MSFSVATYTRPEYTRGSPKICPFNDGDVHARFDVFTLRSDVETPVPATSPWYTVHELALEALAELSGPDVSETLIAVPVIVTIKATAATRRAFLRFMNDPPRFAGAYSLQ